MSTDFCAAGAALRVLALAYRPVEDRIEGITSDRLESDLVFLGLVGMIDPPRDEARAAIESCLAYVTDDSSRRRLYAIRSAVRAAAPKAP